MTINTTKLDALVDEVRELKELEQERLEKELEFLKSVQRERGLASVNIINRDECLVFAEDGISSFLAG